MITNYPMTYQNPEEDRFLLAPFLLGGLAGTALGYGISNNNQNNYYPAYPMIQPMPYQTTYTTCPNCPTNNYYF